MPVGLPRAERAQAAVLSSVHQENERVVSLRTVERSGVTIVRFLARQRLDGSETREGCGKLCSELDRSNAGPESSDGDDRRTWRRH